jgi:acyl-CoA synthetase (NDP forming)
LTESLAGVPAGATEPIRDWDLTRLLRPASIAVVGATDRAGTYAAQTLLNLELLGYPGEVWGVNPKRDEVMGRPCVATLQDLPAAADAVVVAIPAAGVPEIIEQAGARGCGGAVVYAAGFAEVTAGRSLQHDLIESARRHRMPVCGPNCDGIVVMARRVALWGDALVEREPGRVALVSQSGNVAVNALASRRGLRFHTVITSGNQAVLGADTYLRFLAEDEEGIGAIALYLEDDVGPGLCDGLAACAERGIRVVVLKVGSSPAGARAAAAHSASLAGDQRVFRSLLNEAGAVWAQDAHELLELAKTLSVPARRPRPSAGLAIMTCSGGDSAQGADECSRLGIPLPELASATRARLEELLPVAATAANPLDYTALLWGERAALAELVRTLGDDPAIDQVLVFYDQLPGVEGAAEESWRAVREAIADGAARSPAATFVSSTLPELLDDTAAWQFAEAGVPAAAGLRTGLRCVAATRTVPGDPGRLRTIAAYANASRAAEAPENQSHWLGEHQSKELLRASGVPVVEGRLVIGEDDAAAAVEQLGGTIALKLSAPTVQHKSELGALELGIGSADRARLAYRRLAALAEPLQADVLAERMAAPGVELLIAARTGAVVPALVVALGGTATELLDSVAIVPLPADGARIEEALRAAGFAPLLTGLRGGPGVDLAAAAGVAARTGELLLEAGLAEVELNPVLVSSVGAVAVDALVRVRC